MKTQYNGWLNSDKYRVETRGCGIYSIYERRGDAYVHCAIVRAASKADAIDVYETEER